MNEPGTVSLDPIPDSLQIGLRPNFQTSEAGRDDTINRTA